MKKESNSGISFFQRYLTVWVIICMLIGIMLGHFLPGMKEALNYLECGHPGRIKGERLPLGSQCRGMAETAYGQRHPGGGPSGLYQTAVRRKALPASEKAFHLKGHAGT